MFLVQQEWLNRAKIIKTLKGRTIQKPCNESLKRDTYRWKEHKMLIKDGRREVSTKQFPVKFTFNVFVTQKEPVRMLGLCSGQLVFPPGGVGRGSGYSDVLTASQARAFWSLSSAHGLSSDAGLVAIWRPLTLKFVGVTQPFLEFNRRHWTLLKSTGPFEKWQQGTLPFLIIDRRHWTILKSPGKFQK